MSNELNIFPVNFTKTDETLFIDDPILSIKVINDPNWTEFKTFGYAELEKSFSEENTYAEFSTGIPEMLVAKKKISTKRSFSCQLKQLQPETLAILQNARIESGDLSNYVHIGSDSPTPVQLSIILSGKNYAGKSVELRLRKVLPTTDTLELALGSAEFASMAFNGEVVVDDDPLKTNFDWRAYSEIEATATNTASSDVLTLASANPAITAGDRVYGAGIPDDTSVLTVDTVTITLDKPITSAYAVARAVKFIDPAEMLKSDVAYWILEK